MYFVYIEDITWGVFLILSQRKQEVCLCNCPEILSHSSWGFGLPSEERRLTQGTFFLVPESQYFIVFQIWKKSNITCLLVKKS